ncbi:MAG: YkgJ family cysteine cluster protein [Nitrospirota bacterium]
MKRIKKLYAEMPSFTCLEGCTECCGPIPFTRDEWKRVKDKRKATSVDCPYFLNGRCDIYADRPFICRLYGAAEDLKCPYGCRPEKLLTAEKSAELTKAYLKLMHEG